MEQDVIWHLLSQTCKSGSNTKEEWRNQNSGDSNSRGQNCPDGGEAVLRTMRGANLL